MVTGSVGWFIWIFVAVTTASDYREPVSIIGYDPEVTFHGPRTKNSEWSVVESVQKFAELPGSGARLVVDRAAVAGSRPAVAAMLEHQVVGAPRDVGDPILQQLRDLLQNSRVANMNVQAPSAALTDTEPEAGCGQQVSEQLSAETAVAVAVWAMKHSCDSQREAAVGFIKDNMGQVLATQGWAHAVRTQPEEVVQLSRLLAERMTATSTPATTQSTTTTTTTTASQPDGDYSGHDQTSDDAPAHVTMCPTTPLDELRVSLFRTLPEEQKGEMLIEAAKEGNVDQLRSLLAAGASPSTKNWRSVVHWAALRGHAEALSCLLDAGASVATTDDNGYQTLHMAAMGGNPDAVRLLAAWGADLNARDNWGWTPLHLTVREKKPEAALALLEVGADGEVRSKGGFTPLELASGGEYQDQEMANVLALGK